MIHLPIMRSILRLLLEFQDLLASLVESQVGAS